MALPKEEPKDTYQSMTQLIDKVLSIDDNYARTDDTRMGVQIAVKYYEPLLSEKDKEIERLQKKVVGLAADVEKAFTQGYTCAVANLIQMHGMGTEARDLYRSGGCKFDEFEKYSIDAGDAETLKKYKSSLERG